eukprot:m.445571 g.445571  ORF g.445571 m.445571 type:complete len:340 (+) comp19246_c0_seq1:959-1978(+)
MSTDSSEVASDSEGPVVETRASAAATTAAGFKLSSVLAPSRLNVGLSAKASTVPAEPGATRRTLMVGPFHDPELTSAAPPLGPLAPVRRSDTSCEEQGTTAALTLAVPFPEPALVLLGVAAAALARLLLLGAGIKVVPARFRGVLPFGAASERARAVPFTRTQSWSAKSLITSAPRGSRCPSPLVTNSNPSGLSNTSSYAVATACSKSSNESPSFTSTVKKRSTWPQSRIALTFKIIAVWGHTSVSARLQGADHSHTPRRRALDPTFPSSPRKRLLMVKFSHSACTACRWLRARANAEKTELARDLTTRQSATTMNSALPKATSHRSGSGREPLAVRDL